MALTARTVRTANSQEAPRKKGLIAQAQPTRTTFAITAAAFLFLHQGCATVRPTDPYEKSNLTIPEPTLSFASGKDAPAPHGTSKPLAEQGLARSLALDACIKLALENNPEVAAAWWDSEAATAEKRVQAGERWPNVHLTGSYFHYQDDQRLVPPSSPGEATYFTDDLVSADLVLRLPLYAGGRIVNEVRAAELLARSAEHTLARTREELVFNVTSTYYAILAQRHVIESLEFSRKTLEEHVARVQNLIDAQKAAKVDRLRTEVRLADLDQQLIQERNVLAIQLRLLSNLMGLTEEKTSMLDIAGDLSMPEAASSDTAIAHALDRREDYAAAMAALEAQARRVDIARGAREPQVALEASYGGRWGIGGSGELGTQPSNAYSWTSGEQSSTSSASTTPLPNGGSLTTTTTSTGSITTRISQSGVEPADDFEDLGRVGVTVDIPLFEGGSLRAQAAKERARLHAAQQRLRKLELQIRLEVETALLNLESARERVVVTRKSIAEAEESLRIEREKYDFGKGAIVDVLDAQAALLNAQTTHYRALADMNVAQAQLALAIGEQR